MIEILEIAIGLAFVYLLIALIVSALNEYLAAIFNRRGRFLYDGIVKLLRETNVPSPEQFFQHPLISSLFKASAGRDRLPAGKEAATKAAPGAVQTPAMRKRTPSYIPARSFAMALLDLKDRGWRLPEGKGIDAIVDVLKKDSLLDVTEFVNRPDVAKALQAANIPVDDLKARAQAEVAKLHDSVEVWFNNAMDRVSGAYKRYTQVLLILMGFVAAVVVNADTFQIWRTLAANDELRARVVLQVQEVMADSSFRRLVFPTPAPTDTAATDTAATDTAVRPPATDTAVTDTAAPDTTGGGTAGTDTTATDTPRSGGTAGTSGSGTAKADSAALDRLKRTLAVLEGNDLDLGWTKADRDYFFSFPGFFVKLLGFLVTGIAVSLGAPFWFDTLNKIIAIRLAGRAPDEKPKNPEGGPKRAAEAAPR